jgi:hypothetical protein
MLPSGRRKLTWLGRKKLNSEPMKSLLIALHEVTWFRLTPLCVGLSFDLRLEKGEGDELPNPELRTE